MWRNVGRVAVLGWVHTCNVIAYRNTLSWQCGRDSWPRNVSKVGYAETLRACSVCCRYLAVASRDDTVNGLSRCGRATSRWTSTSAQAVMGLLYLYLCFFRRVFCDSSEQFVALFWVARLKRVRSVFACGTRWRINCMVLPKRRIIREKVLRIEASVVNCTRKILTCSE